MTIVVSCGIAWPSIASLSVAATERPAAAAKLLVLGDSWSAEYGLKRGTGWIALLEARLRQTPSLAAIRVVNASVSGETTAGGLSRLSELLEKHQPRWVLIALGGNDALRGLPLETTRSQLLAMIRKSREKGAQVLLIGMRMPPNYGNYGRSFEDMFPSIARSQKVMLVPFLMRGKEYDLSLFQPDRIHPNEDAQLHMLEQAWPSLEQLLKKN